MNWQSILNSIPGIIAGVASSSTLGAILKLSLTLALTVAGVLLVSKLNQLRQAQVNQQNAQNIAQEQGSLPTDVGQISASGDAAASAIDTIRNTNQTKS